MMKYLRLIWQCLSDPIDLRLERYLAGSTDLADLERRQQRWFSMSESAKNRWW